MPSGRVPKTSTTRMGRSALDVSVTVSSSSGQSFRLGVRGPRTMNTGCETAPTPRGPRNGGSYTMERTISHAVSERVVHELELIEIQEEQGELLIRAPGTGSCFREKVVKEVAVGETSELIVGAEVLLALMGFA